MGRARSPCPLALVSKGNAARSAKEAARQLCGDQVKPVPFQRFEDVFQALTAKKVDRAVIPIENTLHGSVHENYDHLLRFDLPIIAETSVRIVHNLIACPGVTMRQVKRVYSHPVALTQCLDFFTANPQIERVPFYDTAGSVKMITEQKLPDAGAIASSVAAANYGARILKKSIEDDRRNFTRFFLLCRREDEAELAPEGVAKTSIVFATRNSRRCPVSRAECVCFARSEFDQNRVAAVAWEAVGIPFLCRFHWP